METVNFTIRNATFLNTPYNFSLNQKVATTASIGVIQEVDNHTITIAKSDRLDLPISMYSGIYWKQQSPEEGRVLTIPLTIRSSEDTDMLNLFTSASYELIFNSIQGDISLTTESGSTTSTTQTSNLSTHNGTSIIEDKNGISLDGMGEVVMNNKEVLLGLGLGTGIVIAGLAIHQSKTSNGSIKPSKEDEIWSPKTPWVLIILTPILWIIGNVLFPPDVRRLSHSDVLDNTIRQNILTILKERGFEHFNTLREELGTGVSVLRWHLQVLEDFGYVEYMNVGQYKIFHLQEHLVDKEKVELYCSIRTKKALKIVKSFLNQDEITVDALADNLNLDKNTARYHCKKLLDLNLIESKTANNGKYRVKKESYNKLRWLLERYNVN